MYKCLYLDRLKQNLRLKFDQIRSKNKKHLPFLWEKSDYNNQQYQILLDFLPIDDILSFHHNSIPIINSNNIHTFTQEKCSIENDLSNSYILFENGKQYIINQFFSFNSFSQKNERNL